MPLLAVAAAPVADTLEQRISEIERRVGGQAPMQMTAELQRMRGEIRDLRGQLEENANALQTLQRQQRELYLDLDRRLSQSHSDSGGETTPPLGDSSARDAADEAPPERPTDNAVADEAGLRIAYERAFNQLKEGRYDDSIAGFRQFIAKYGSGEFADNAQYWIGEAYYVTRRYDEALREFQHLLNDYPQSRKRADATLKIGYIQFEKKDWAAARRTLIDVGKQWPDTSVARLAASRLQKMVEEGH